MEQRIFKKTGEAVSLLGMGCMRLPVKDDKIDRAEAQRLIDYAYAHGVNYFDTAHMYHGGESEPFVGEAMAKYPRDSYFLASKMPIWMADTPADVERIFQKQLDSCRTDYFDFYLLHAQDHKNFPRVKEFGAYETLCRLRDEGKIRHLGFSFHDAPEVLEEILNTYRFDFVQIQLNYVDWTQQNARRQYELIEQAGIPCIVMEPVRGGALANPGDKVAEMLRAARPNDSLASWAIRYAASFPNVLTVLSGMSSMEQVEDNVRTMTGFEPLSEREAALLEDAAEIFKNKDRIPCTGCRYCMDCPNGVDIPKMFSVFNETYALDKNKDWYRGVYRGLPEEITAKNCIACGLCAAQCPQSIDIPAHLQQIADLQAAWWREDHPEG